MLFQLKTALNSFTGKVTRKLIDSEHKKFLPKSPTLEDIYLVSFPKSGNTWLRFLVANAVGISIGVERDVNFFSIHDIIPDIYLSRDLRPEGVFGRPDLPRIIKSHSSYNPYYHRVILLVRDPRDALVSYYHYLRQRGNIPEYWTLSSFIRNPKYGVKAWLAHTDSWYSTLKQGQIVQIFLYEDFLKKPKEELARFVDLLGLTLDDADVEKAIALSSKEKMKQSENTHRSTYLIKNKERPFVRKGEATGGKELSDDDRKYIEQETQHIAEIIGYKF
jgi:hypothetical protein